MDKGYQPDMGARPLRRAIEQYLEDPLAEKLLAEPLESCKFFVSKGEKGLTFIDHPLDEKEMIPTETAEEK